MEMEGSVLSSVGTRRIPGGVVVVVVVVMPCVVVFIVVMVVVMMLVFLFRFKRRDALRGFRIRHAALCHRPQHFAAFQAQAVEQHQFCRRNFFHIAAGELIGVRVLVCAHQAGYLHALAANLLGNIAQHAKTGYRRQRFCPKAA